MKYFRYGILVSSLLFFNFAYALPAQSEPGKTEIDNYARSNGFPRSDYPYYEAVNSCGGEGVTAAVPDKYEVSTDVPSPTLQNPWRTRLLVVFRADFNDACNNHDRCYMTAGTPRENCDARFLTDLLAACDSGDLGEQFFDLISGATATCASLAGTYSGTVAISGLAFYPDAQRQARRYASLVDSFDNSSQLPSAEVIEQVQGIHDDVIGGDGGPQYVDAAKSILRREGASLQDVRNFLVDQFSEGPIQRIHDDVIGGDGGPQYVDAAKGILRGERASRQDVRNFLVDQFSERPIQDIHDEVLGGDGGPLYVDAAKSILREEGASLQDVRDFLITNFSR